VRVREEGSFIAVDQKHRAIESHHEHADLFQQRYEQLQQNP